MWQCGNVGMKVIGKGREGSDTIRLKRLFMNSTPNPISELILEFSLYIIEYTEELERLKKFNLANQLFKSGTSIGANVSEAQSCESRADFIHKVKVAAKEAEETKYWLTLCTRAKSYPKPTGLAEKLQIIIKILNKIVVTSKRVKAQ
jgi:four helix bundle protein